MTASAIEILRALACGQPGCRCFGAFRIPHRRRGERHE